MHQLKVIMSTCLNFSSVIYYIIYQSFKGDIIHQTRIDFITKHAALSFAAFAFVLMNCSLEFFCTTIFVAKNSPFYNNCYVRGTFSPESAGGENN